MLAALLLILIVGLSPYWLGSNRPLPWSGNALGVGLVAILAGVGLLVSRQHPALRLDRIAVPLVLIVLVLVWAVIQALPLNLLAHPAWQVTGEALGRSLDGSISVNPSQTCWAITRWATAGAVLGIAYCLGRDRALALLMLRGFLVMAGLAAVYGLVRVAFSLDKILWFDVAARSLLTSGFLNQNSAATFFGMAALCALVLIIEGTRQILRESNSGHDLLRRAGDHIGGRLGLDLICFFTLFVALLVTASRGGILATLAGALVLVILYGLRSRRRQGPGGTGWTLAIVLGLVLMAGVFELAGVRFTSRLAQQGLAAELRLDTYRATLDAISDYLWIGSGLGTFQDVFPAYRTEVGNWIWDKAHNDYLELVLGLGVPAALVMLLGLGLLVLITLSGFFSRRRDGQFAAAAVGVSVLVALHAAVDFSLQIQANTLAFALILGLGLAQSVSSRA